MHNCGSLVNTSKMAADDAYCKPSIKEKVYASCFKQLLNKFDSYFIIQKTCLKMFLFLLALCWVPFGRYVRNIRLYKCLIGGNSVLFVYWFVLCMDAKHCIPWSQI